MKQIDKKIVKKYFMVIEFKDLSEFYIGVTVS